MQNDVPYGFDGLSGFIKDKYPVIVANKNKTAERQRLTMLHGLAMDKVVLAANLARRVHIMNHPKVIGYI